MTTHPEDDTSPRASLGTWPTPLEPAPRLARALGLGAEDLWVKRDDLTGLGGGGNKIRKLEWTCGAALAEEAVDHLVRRDPGRRHAAARPRAQHRREQDERPRHDPPPGGSGTAGGQPGRPGARNRRPQDRKPCGAVPLHENALV